MPTTDDVQKAERVDSLWRRRLRLRRRRIICATGGTFRTDNFAEDTEYSVLAFGKGATGSRGGLAASAPRNRSTEWFQFSGAKAICA